MQGYWTGGQGNETKDATSSRSWAYVGVYRDGTLSSKELVANHKEIRVHSTVYSWIEEV